MNTTRRTAMKAMALACTSLTLPLSAQASVRKLKQAIKLGVIADPHIGFVKGAPERLADFLKAMKNEEPDALLQLGDFAFSNEQNKPHIDAFNAAHEVTLHTIGNHDIRDKGLRREDCISMWGIPAPYYTHDVQGMRLIVLDGNDPGSPTYKGGYPSYIGKKQQAWLKRQLEAADKPVLIVSHQPLAGWAEIDNASEIRTLLAEYRDRILLCINGHSHCDQFLTIEGLSYLHINSASYKWLGGKVRLVEYKDALFATLAFDPKKGEIRVNGVQSEWKNRSPEDVNYFGRNEGEFARYREVTVPRISNRIIATPNTQRTEAKLVNPPQGFRWDKPVVGHATRDKAGLHLRNQAGRIWAGKGNRNRLLTKETVVNGDAVTVDLELRNALHKYEQAGLVLHQNDDAFVKFVVEHINGVHYVVMGRELEGKRKVLAKIEIMGSRADLRLRLKDGQVLAQWRPGGAADSAPWRDASTSAYPGEGVWHFGVFSQDANPDRPGSALVRKIELKR